MSFNARLFRVCVYCAKYILELLGLLLYIAQSLIQTCIIKLAICLDLDEYSVPKFEDKRKVPKSQDKRKVPKSQDKHRVLKSQDKHRVLKSQDKRRVSKFQYKRRISKFQYKRSVWKLRDVRRVLKSDDKRRVTKYLISDTQTSNNSIQVLRKNKNQQKTRMIRKD
jgi:lipopolysaccharide export LptBFGC system permease protein LptF